MKINLLKSGKSVLTFVLAFCVLAVSLFTTSVVVNAAATWDGTTASAYKSGTGAENDPFIIENVAQLHKMVKDYGKDANGNAAYFKVADGVTALYVNEVTSFDAATVTDSPYSNNWVTGLSYDDGGNANGKAFVGKFDGNGATIYGLYAYNAAKPSVGFVPSYGQGAVIKNVAFEAAYIKNALSRATEGAAVIAGRAYAGGASIEVTAVSIVNCYVSGGYAGAAFVGNQQGKLAAINTCLVADCKILGGSYASGAVNENWGAANTTVSRSIFVGITPEGSKNDNNPLVTYSDVYSDTDTYRINSSGTPVLKTVAGITVNKTGSFKGAEAKTTMPTIGWGISWNLGGEGKYPTPVETDLNYNIWDGTNASAYAGGTGAQADPFIIKTVAQLHKMVADYGKADGNAAYFKVADDVDVLYVNAPVSFDAATVTDSPYANNWMSGLDYDAGGTSGEKAFVGKFDGNGVTISGLYAYYESASRKSVGFIPSYGDGAVVKKASFEAAFVKNDANRATEGAAVVAGRAYAGGASIEITEVAVKNSFVSGGYAGAGFVGNQQGKSSAITNCLMVACNISGATYTAGAVNETWGADNSTVSKSVFIGTTPETTKNDSAALSIFTDVHTDTDAYRIKDGNPIKKTVEGVTVVTNDELKGATLKLEGLDYTNNWIATVSYPELRVFHTLSTISVGENGHKSTCSDAGCTVDFGTASHVYGDDTVCDVCSYAHTHDYKDNGAATPAKCTEAGSQPTKCACGAESSREIAALGHTFGETVAAKGATCNDKGNVAYKTCSRCSKNFAADAAVDSTAPLATVENADFGAHIWGAEDSVVSECTGGRIYFKQCSVCQKYAYSNSNNTSYDETNLKNSAPSTAGHTWVAQVALESECSKVADIEYDKCDACGKYTVDGGANITSTAPVAAGHAWGAEQKKESECVDDKDVLYKECTNGCGKFLVGTTVVDSVEVLGHGENTDVKEDKDGHIITYCTECDLELSMYLKLETEDYSIFADSGVFAPDVSVQIEKVEFVDEAAKKAMLESLLEFDIKPNDVAVYTINATDPNGTVVQPNGSVTIKVKVPSNFSSDIKYYHVYSTAMADECDELTLVEGEIVIDHFSSIVIADFGLASDVNDGGDSGSTSSTPSTSTPSTDNSATGTDTESPATGDNATVVVAGIALVIAAAFVLVLKARKA